MADGLLRVTTYSLRTYWRSVFVITLLLVLPPLVLRSLPPEGIQFLNRLLFIPLPAATLDGHLFFVAFSGFLFLVLGLNVLDRAQKSITRIPVATAEIVSGLILTSLIITVVVSLVSVAVYRQFIFGEARFNERWPVLGPTLFLSTMVVVMHCAFWHLKALGVFRLIFWPYFCAGAIGWFVTRYSPGESPGYFVPWKQVTPVEFLTMSVVFIAAWFGAIRSCALVRCGVAVPTLTWERLKKELDDLKRRTLIARRKHPDSISAGVAQLYWLDSCRTLILLIALLGCLVFFINLVFFIDHTTQGEIELNPFMSPMFGISAIYSIQAAIAILFVGLINSLAKRKDHQMKGYLAGVPLSDRELSAVLLRCILKCVILSLLFVVILGLAGSYVAFVLLQGTDVIRQCWQSMVAFEAKGEIVVFAGYALLAYWIFVANSISFFWMISSRFSENVILLLPLLLIAAVCGIFYPAFGFILLLLFALLSWSATVIAYIQAYRTSLIGSQIIWLAALFCLIVPAFYWNFWNYSELPLKLFRSSSLVLAITPFATIPLAVSWNRHR
ncbi:hypothetical protein HG66A1_60240 [Gimesia chilikensis]|uniref:Uncharacterized protein n=2 Tax=Gimesia chilikensis TaxID=2605989 RepID=A0A517PXY9_9PLAN|nr:hypothetical protein HG66A1_60240 [Gimesia chilikensis]